jgi:hypothetical protein
MMCYLSRLNYGLDRLIGGGGAKRNHGTKPLKGLQPSEIKKEIEFLENDYSIIILCLEKMYLFIFLSGNFRKQNPLLLETNMAFVDTKP